MRLYLKNVKLTETTTYGIIGLIITPTQDVYDSGTTVQITGDIDTLYFVAPNVLPVKINALSDGTYSYILPVSNGTDSYYFTTAYYKISSSNFTINTPYFFNDDTLDTFYETDITHTIISSQFDSTKSLYVTYGGNGLQQGTSESLSYALNYFVNKYLLTNDTDIFTKIIQLLNTITELIWLVPGATTKGNVNTYQYVYFPPWQYNINSGKLSFVSGDIGGNAQDSNQEILKNLIILYLYIKDTSISSSELLILKKSIINSFFTGLEYTIPSDDAGIIENINRIIQMMIYSLLTGIDVYNNSTVYSGNFSYDYTLKKIMFGTSCINPDIIIYTDDSSGYWYPNNSVSLYSQKFSDYVSFSLYIYIEHYLELNNKSISDYEGYTVDALQNQLDWLKGCFPDNVANIYGSENFSAVFNRLGQQLVECLLLYEYGNSTVNVFATGYYLPTMIEQMQNIMTSMINLEVSKGVLQLQNGVPTYLSSEIYIDSNVASGYFRHMSYIIYMKMYSLTLDKRVLLSGDNYNLSTHTPEQWFGIGDDTIPLTFYKQAIDFTTATIDYFKTWKTNYWITNTDEYFAFVICIIHQSNYLLYKNRA
jgi:hypothetical protein